MTPTAGRAVAGPAPDLPGFRPPGGRRTLQRSIRRGHLPILSAQQAVEAGASGPHGTPAPAGPPEDEPELTPAPRILSAVDGAAPPTAAPTVAPAIDHPAAFRPVVAPPEQPPVAQLMATGGPEPAAAEASAETSVEASPAEQTDTDDERAAEARPLVGVIGGEESVGERGPGEALLPPAIQRRDEDAGGNSGPRTPTVSRAEPTRHVGPARLHDTPAGPIAAAAPTGPAAAPRPVGSLGTSAETVGAHGSGAVQRQVAGASGDPHPVLPPPGIGTASRPAPDPPLSSGTVPSGVVDPAGAMPPSAGSTERPVVPAGAVAPESEPDAAAPEAAAAGAPVVSRSVVLPADVRAQPFPPDRSAVAQQAGLPPAPEVQRALVSEDAPLAGGTAIGPVPGTSRSAGERHEEAASSVREPAVDGLAVPSAPRAVPPAGRTGTDDPDDHASVAGAEPVEAPLLAAGSPTVSRMPADEVSVGTVEVPPLGMPMPPRAADDDWPGTGPAPEADPSAGGARDGARGGPAGASHPAPGVPDPSRLAVSATGSDLVPAPVQRVPVAPLSGDTVLPVPAGTRQDRSPPEAPASRPRRPGLGEPLTGPLDLQRIAVPADSVQPSPHRSGVPAPAFERGTDHTVLAIPPLPGSSPPRAADDVDTGLPPVSPGGPVPAVAPAPTGSAGMDDLHPAVGQGLPPVPVVARVVPLLGAGPSVAGPLTGAGVPPLARPADVGGNGGPSVRDGLPPAAVTWPGDAAAVQRVPAGTSVQGTRNAVRPGPVPWTDGARGPAGSARFAPAPWGAAGVLTVARETAPHDGAVPTESIPPSAAVLHDRQEVVQRLDTPAPEPVAAPPPEPATAAAPAPAAAGATAAPSAAALDELVRRLYDPLSARLKDELRLDRERAGLITDLRR
ncbi:hypothetical protein [Blastococcus sp. CT_GayMR19]|uniref:hypothetical protein n=1 Tax=Blastococcus sp. CT_GayMR19 TaxID=2559608 RepID=UPI001430639D|nr:hypothetical protein [Blastococcus sp. CT_GayMR19]